MLEILTLLSEKYRAEPLVSRLPSVHPGIPWLVLRAPLGPDSQAVTMIPAV